MTADNNDMVLRPRVHPSVFVAEGARIYGDVIIDEGANLWFNAVVRGDEGRVTIGRGCNIQDNVVIHSDLFEEVCLGDRVTVGHGAVLRGCRIGNDVMVGMNSTVMTHVDIGERCIVAAGSVVPYHKTFPPRTLIAGAPARAVRPLTDDEAAMNDVAVQCYHDLKERYASGTIAGHSPSKE